MKKMIKRFVKYSAASLGLLALFSSCEVGLGNAVDTQAPVVSLQSHKDNDSVADSFLLYGYASDNDEIASITIDFYDADMHYKVVPGSQWYKKAEGFDWKAIPTDDHNRCYLEEGKWKWFVDVDTHDKCSSKEGNNYSFEIVVKDVSGNSGKSSKTQCSLIVDTSNPSVSIYKPELFPGNYSDVKTTTSAYKLKDGNVLNRLINGIIQLQGRQSDALSFEALKIQFDNGQLKSGERIVTCGQSVKEIEEIDTLPEAVLGDDPAPTVYYEKTIKASDLREWSLTVNPEDWATSEDGISNGLDTGYHLIRIVTTSLSYSKKWERKVIGYFVWWPESDTPWISASAGDDVQKDTDIYECYPGSNFSGSAQDDDVISKLVSTLYISDEATGEYVLYADEGYKNPENHKLPSDDAKYAAWSVQVPAQNGKFKLVMEVTDKYGNSSSLTKYFKTSDVSAPKIEITAPADNSSAIIDLSGNIKFTGTAVDNGKLASFAVVWLNPAKSSDPSNKIKYLTGEHTDWDSATAEGWTDKNGNKIYLFDTQNKSSYTLNKTFNLYSDFGVDGENIPLTAQEFIFRAVDDSGTKAIKTISLTGDSITPELEFTDITINGLTLPFDESNLPSFPKISNGTKATITGTWSDKFTSELKNSTKVNKIKLTWGDETVEAAVNTSNGKWTVVIEAPSSGGTITASLSDYAGNKKTVQTAASIETSELGLSRVDCQNDDGAYKAGATLNLTLEFTKNTDCVTTAGVPTLTLNNGGVATYVSGSGTATHVYEYKVTASSADNSKLTVTAINSNGAKWYDSAAKTSELQVTAADIPTRANLGDTRTIIIDNTLPRVKAITSLSAAGYYKEGAAILLMMEFSEDVTITGAKNLAVNFAHKNAGFAAKAASPSVTGSKYVLFTYNVAAGDNANPLTFASITNTSVAVTDNAGNNLTVWTPVNTPSFAGVIVDTTVPSGPSFGSWNPAAVIFDEDGTSFTLTNNGETDIESMEYSLDNGSNWTPYTATVDIPNNGKYTVVARQTDRAGNVSALSSPAVKTFRIDKGDLLVNITADTVNGTYSTSTSTKSVAGKIIFRKEVTIPANATVTLNVKNGTGTTYKTCAINECTSAASTAKQFTFNYAIAMGDYVTDSDGYLDVIDWSFDSVRVKEYSFDAEIDLDSISAAQRFDGNRKIKIVTGIPQVKSVAMTGEGAATVLSVTFDRDITKVGGNIVFDYDTSSNEFRVPAVLSTSEYNELKTYSAVVDSYEAAPNGAVKSGNLLVNDSTKKYVLKTSVSNTTTALVNAFISAGKAKSTVPVISDQVQVSESDSKVLEVKLGEAYQLPVKGAVYSLTIPANTVTDAVSNKNAVYNGKVTAAGVESPEIRLVRPSYSITNAGNTKMAYADMTVMQSAQMYLTSRTPGSTIYYGINGLKSGKKIVNSNPILQVKTNTEASYAQMNTHQYDYDPGTFVCVTDAPTVPQNINTEYTAAVALGSEDTYKVDTYDNANGVKFAIAATAAKGGVTSAPSYEYATRSVLKFMISNYRDAEGNNTSNDSSLKLKDLKVWLCGGDAPEGENSTETCSLKWNDPSGYKLMGGQKKNWNSTTGETSGDGNTSMYGYWWWISWDVTSATYIGFVAGDVPADAETNGPTFWYTGDYLWTLIKSEYSLNPGETLVMMAHGTQSNGQCADYIYDTTEKMWYYAPYYARFSFNMQKMKTR